MYFSYYNYARVEFLDMARPSFIVLGSILKMETHYSNIFIVCVPPPPNAPQVLDGLRGLPS